MLRHNLLQRTYQRHDSLSNSSFFYFLFFIFSRELRRTLLRMEASKSHFHYTPKSSPWIMLEWRAVKGPHSLIQESASSTILAKPSTRSRICRREYNTTKTAGFSSSPISTMAASDFYQIKVSQEFRCQMFSLEFLKIKVSVSIPSSTIQPAFKCTLSKTLQIVKEMARYSNGEFVHKWHLVEFFKYTVSF